jgi:hypothetical protein
MIPSYELLCSRTLPAPVVDHLVDEYWERCGDALVRNPRVRSLRPDIVRRVDVLDSLLWLVAHQSDVRTWVLAQPRIPARLLWRLAATRLDADEKLELGAHMRGSGADLFIRGGFTHEARAVAAPFCSLRGTVLWSVFGNDDEARAALVGAVQTGGVHLGDIIEVLLMKPALRGWAVRSGRDELVVAACWTELAAEDHEVALATAATLADYHNTGNDPVVGLLNQPGLAAGLRARARDMLEARPSATTWKNTQGLGAWSHGTHGPLGEIADPELLSVLLRSATLSTTGSMVTRNRRITLTLLCGLAHNPHLNATQRETLVTGIHEHYNWQLGKRSYALEAAMVALGAVDTAYGLPDRARREAFRDIFDNVRRRDYKNYNRTLDVECTIDGGGVDVVGGVIDVLGDGGDVTSRARWGQVIEALLDYPNLTLDAALARTLAVAA